MKMMRLSSRRGVDALNCSSRPFCYRHRRIPAAYGRSSFSGQRKIVGGCRTRLRQLPSMTSRGVNIFNYAKQGEPKEPDFRKRRVKVPYCIIELAMPLYRGLQTVADLSRIRPAISQVNTSRIACTSQRGDPLTILSRQS